MRLLIALLLAAALSSTLTGCFPVVAGGAAAGGMAAADRRTSGAYVEDEAIEWKVSGRIKDMLGDKIHLNVTSFNRSVLMTGEALDEATRTKAEELAKGVPNVVRVNNELQIGGASQLSARSNDAYLTTKVKSNFFTENRFPPIYVKVVTENAVVYLLGIVTHKEAEDAADIASKVDGVQKVVKIFEYID